jgi:hypothetical protein
MRSDNKLLGLTGKVLSNNDSAEKLTKVKSISDIKEIFENNEIKITSEEVERIGILLNNDELNEEMLDTVNGGGAVEMIILGGVLVSLAAVGACRAAYLSIKKD